MPFNVYANGQPVLVESQGVTRSDQIARTSRALSLVGHVPYHPLTANCDHAASYAEKGVAESPQVMILVTTALALVLIWAVTRP